MSHHITTVRYGRAIGEQPSYRRPRHENTAGTAIAGARDSYPHEKPKQGTDKSACNTEEGATQGSGTRQRNREAHPAIQRGSRTNRHLLKTPLRITEHKTQPQD